MCKATKKADAYSITKDAKTKAFNISFNGVYSNEIRKLMFDNHFRWSKTNACFYGWTKDILSLSSQIQKLVYDWRNVDIKSKFIECPLILENDIQTIEVYKNKKDYLEQQRLEEELRKQEEEKREKEWFAGLVEEFGERSANFIKGFLTIFEGSLHFNIDLELNYSKPGDEKELIAKAIAKKIAGYNDWTPEKFNKIFEIMNRYSIAQYGEDNPNNGKRNWTMRFGRESSIVTYLDASFNDEETANKCYKEIESMIHPDELSIENSFPMFANNIHKTFRLWWD
jgi:hypothetical protein